MSVPKNMSEISLMPGQRTRIRQSIRSPYSGHVGTILDIDTSDKNGAFLVSFPDGLQFRYTSREIEPLDAVPFSNLHETARRLSHFIRSRHPKTV